MKSPIGDSPGWDCCCNMAESRRIFFTGRVQGVGFRAMTLRTAHGFPIAGRVRNKADGRVELIVEGDPDVLDRFLAALHAAMPGAIEKMDIVTESGSGRFSDFAIDYESWESA